jgi:hypothetical protein
MLPVRMHSQMFAERGSTGRARWLKINELPVSRSVAYELINSGVVASVLLTWPGSKRGIRLVDSDSLASYIEKLMAQQGARK